MYTCTLTQNVCKHPTTVDSHYSGQSPGFQYANVQVSLTHIYTQWRVTIVVVSVCLSVCLFLLNLKNGKFYGDKCLYTVEGYSSRRVCLSVCSYSISETAYSTVTKSCIWTRNHEFSKNYELKSLLTTGET